MLGNFEINLKIKFFWRTLGSYGFLFTWEWAKVAITFS